MKMDNLRNLLGVRSMDSVSKCMDKRFVCSARGQMEDLLRFPFLLSSVFHFAIHSL